MVKKAFFLLFTLILLFFIITPFIIGLLLQTKINDNLLKFNHTHPELFLKKETFTRGLFSSTTTIQFSFKEPLKTKVISSSNTLSLPLTYQIKIYHGPVVFISNHEEEKHWYFSPFIATYKINQVGFNTKGLIKGSFGQGILLNSNAKNIDIKFDFATLHLKQVAQRERLALDFTIKNVRGKIGKINVETNNNNNPFLLTAKQLTYTAQLSPEISLNQLNVPLLSIKNKMDKSLFKTKYLIFNLKRIKNKKQKARTDLIGETRIGELDGQLPNNPILAKSVLAALNIDISDKALKKIKHSVPFWWQNHLIKNRNKPIINTLISQGLNLNLKAKAKTMETSNSHAKLTVQLPGGSTSLLTAIIRAKASMTFSLPLRLIQNSMGTDLVGQLTKDKFIISNDDKIFTSVLYKNGFFIINGMFYTYPQVLRIIKKISSSYTKKDNSLFFPTRKPWLSLFL